MLQFIAWHIGSQVLPGVIPPGVIHQEEHRVKYSPQTLLGMASNQPNQTLFLRKWSESSQLVSLFQVTEKLTRLSL